jgi:hypothetical protein
LLSRLLPGLLLLLPLLFSLLLPQGYHAWQRALLWRRLLLWGLLLRQTVVAGRAGALLLLLLGSLPDQPFWAPRMLLLLLLLLLLHVACVCLHQQQQRPLQPLLLLLGRSCARRAEELLLLPPLQDAMLLLLLLVVVLVGTPLQSMLPFSLLGAPLPFLVLHCIRRRSSCCWGCCCCCWGCCSWGRARCCRRVGWLTVSVRQQLDIVDLCWHGAGTSCRKPCSSTLGIPAQAGCSTGNASLSKAAAGPARLDKSQLWLPACVDRGSVLPMQLLRALNLGSVPSSSDQHHSIA